MKRKLVLCIGILLILGMVGCIGSSTSAFVGKWVPEGGGKAQSGLPDDMELLKDGTGIVEGMGITWKAENNRLYIIHPLLASSWDYKISGSSLVLTDDSGKNVKYFKK